MARVWFFSDLHLTASDETLYRSLLQLLLEPKGSDDRGVFSGDIFDIVVGNSAYFRHKYSEFWTSLAALLKRGVHVDYIPGNHDFHLEGLLPEGVKVSDESIELLDSQGAQPIKIYVAHGDLVDRLDRQYLRLRKFYRSKAIRFLSTWVPGIWIEKIGQAQSRPQNQKTGELPEHWSIQEREALRMIYRSFAETKNRQGFDYVVLGHCHDFDEVRPYYFNMGYPPVHRQFLYYESGDSTQKELLKRRLFPGI